MRAPEHLCANVHIGCRCDHIDPALPWAPVTVKLHIRVQHSIRVMLQTRSSAIGSTATGAHLMGDNPERVPALSAL